MNNIKIFTDSTSDLSKELIDENNISIIPSYVVFGDEIYKDSIDIDQTGLYEKIKELGKIPKTAAPSPQDFIDAFKPYIDRGDDILYIGLSSKLSSTFQNANIAKKSFPDNKIKLIDTFNLSTGIGLLVLKACDFIKQGMDIENISKKIQQLTHKIKTAFVMDTLEYLHLGGRLSAIQHLLGNILKIKPIIKVVDGELTIAQKVRGRKSKVVDVMLNDVLKNAHNIDSSRLFISHFQGGESVDYLKEQLATHVNVENIHITNTGCVISSHCGPGTVGIAYLEK